MDHNRLSVEHIIGAQGNLKGINKPLTDKHFLNQFLHMNWNVEKTHQKYYTV